MDIPMETSFPVLSEKLLKALDRLYPETRPVPGDSPDTIFYKAGQRSVVAFLIEQHKRQNENVR